MGGFDLPNTPMSQPSRRWAWVVKITRMPVLRASPVLSLPRGDVRAPASVCGDLRHPLAERGLPEDAQRLASVLETDLADADPRRLLHEDRRQPLRRHRPYLDRDR